MAPENDGYGAPVSMKDVASENERVDETAGLVAPGLRPEAGARFDSTTVRVQLHGETVDDERPEGRPC